MIDCTGSGDIDTSKVVSADESGGITGASGRTLKLNPDWVNPTGEWRVGSRRLFELFPRSLQVGGTWRGGGVMLQNACARPGFIICIRLLG